MDRYAHRKSACTLTLLDQQGNPMPGRKVHARLTKHEFKFGCNIFWASGMFDPKLPPERREHLQRMWDSWSALFNFGTLPFYQGQYEPKEGVTREASILKTAKFLDEHGVALKGHPLCWHTVSAKWLMEKSDEEVLENQLYRIRREVGAFKDYIHMWDVINEVVIMPIFTAEENAITRLCAKIGRVALVKAVFDMARQTDPNATLLLNDFNTSEKYKDATIERLAFLDEITEIANRNKLMQDGPEIYERCKAMGTSCWIIVLDIDRFHMYLSNMILLPDDQLHRAVDAGT